MRRLPTQEPESIHGSPVDLLLEKRDGSGGSASTGDSNPQISECLMPSSPQLVWVDCYFYGFWLEESKISGYRDSVAPRSRGVHSVDLFFVDCGLESSMRML